MMPMKIDEEEDCFSKPETKDLPNVTCCPPSKLYIIDSFFFPFKFPDLVDRNKAMLPPDVIYKTLLPMHICGFFEAEKYGS